MGYTVADQTTATAVTASLTTLIDWVNIEAYETFHIVTENTGGGSGNDITDVQLDVSDDAGVTVTTDKYDVTPAASITSGVSDHVSFTTANVSSAKYVRIRVKCTTAEDTTAKCWLTADTLSTTVDTYALTSLAQVKAYMGVTATTNDAVFARLINAVSAAIETYCDRKFKARAYTMERQDGNGQYVLYVRNYPIISVERVATSTAGALQVKCTDTGAYSATCSITRSSGSLPANTHLKLSILGGTNAGDTSLALGTYATMTTLAAKIVETTGWTATVVSGYAVWASTELITIGSSECLNTFRTMEVPDERLDNYGMNQVEGSIFYGGRFGQWYKNIYLDYNGGYATIPADLEQTAIEITSDVFESRKVNANLKSEKIGDYSYSLGDIKTAVSGKSDQLAQWKRYGY